MRKLVEISKHPILGEYKNNLNQLKGKTISEVFVAEDEADYYEIHFTDGTGARIDVHCDKFCDGAPVARAGILFLANVKGVARRRFGWQSEANEGRYPPLPLPSC